MGSQIFPATQLNKTAAGQLFENASHRLNLAFHGLYGFPSKITF
jgi:hypothetical protein